MPKENILIICAHSDDQIFGVGGTAAKYIAEGKRVYSVIFSYGELSHWWLKGHVTAEFRVQESKDADKVIGGSGVTFFGLKENKFIEEAQEQKIHDKLAKIIKKYKPVKVFTHSIDDKHPDHKAVNQIVVDVLNNYKINTDLYTFEVWTPVVVKARNRPKMIVDITKTFTTKLRALRCFKSQWLAMITLLWSVYARALANGIMNKHLFAEAFYHLDYKKNDRN